MGSALILDIDPADIPAELRPKQQAGVILPRLPEIDHATVPKPIGWRVLVLPVEVPDETASGIALAADTVRHLGITRSVGVVLALGDLAFHTCRSWPAGYAPVKPGDWVNFLSIAGQDMQIKDKAGNMVKIKYLNDNDLLGIPPNPEAMMVVV
jgi:co-chaperonin GroES (HSP10)